MTGKGESGTYDRFKVDPLKLAKLSSQQANYDARKMVSWPSPSNMVSIIRYVKKVNKGLTPPPLVLTLAKPKPHTVQFTVKFDPKDSNHFFIRPTDQGYVPCGWFTLKWLEDQLNVAGMLLPNDEDNDDDTD